MLRTLIVDDEIHAREEMQALLSEIGGFDVIGECANSLEAIRAVDEFKPDVVFLDIQMPGIDGFERLNMLQGKNMPRVVFVTAYDEFAIKAFEQNALEYLLKPVTLRRLAITAKKLLSSSPSEEKSIPEISPLKKIPCRGANKFKLIDISEIEFIRSDIAVVYVVCPNGEHYTDLTLKVLEQKTHFTRFHKQYLVNLDLVDEIILADKAPAVIVTRTGRKLPISRRYLRKLKDMLGVGREDEEQQF